MGAIKNIFKQLPGARPLYTIMRRIEGQLRCAGDTYTCPICRKSFGKFRTAGLDQRKNAACPCCGSLERLRLEFLCLQQRTEIFTKKCRVLHFAPEPALTKALRANPWLDYCSGDIEKGRAIFVVDITNINFKDEEFDYVICNHVLEHIPDEAKAFAEIKRVLRPGGQAIITVPADPDAKTTLEQPTASAEERITLFGQDDHVRLYGQDFPQRMQKAGFQTKTFCTDTDVPPELAKKYALLARDTVYLGIR